MITGKKLKKILDEKNISVRKIAKEAEIPPTTIYSIIKRDSNIRYDYALKIAKVLGVSALELCEDDLSSLMINQLIQDFSALNENDKKEVIQFIKFKKEINTDNEKSKK